MAASPPPSLTTYEDILDALNKDVARARPDDALQFCASWFNDKLAEQRAATRNIAREPSPAGMMDITPAPRHGSPRTFSPPPKSALKKKPSGQLANIGYTFGSSSGPNHAAHLHSTDPMPSPFSEAPPPGPFGPTGVSPHGMSRASVAAAASAAAHTSSPSWSSRQPHQHSSLSSSRSRPASDDEDDAGHRTPSTSSVAQMPSSTTSSGGIPLSYNLGRRTSVSAESLDPEAMMGPKRVIPKSSSQRKRIEAVMSQNLLFRNLDEDQHNDVINAMEETTVGQGAVVINQGDVGEIFYIVEHGGFDVYKRPDQTYAYDDPSAPPSSRITSPPPSASGTGPYAKFGKLVGKVEAGGHFGELALMYNAPRAASVICTSPVSVLWSVDRVTFRSILMEHTSKKRRMYERFLGEVPILSTLEPHERAKIADSLEERVYEEGEAVVIEGEVGKNFYLIQSGRAEVTKRRGGTGQEEAVGTLKEGDYFGELALINSAPRAATVRALAGHGRLRVVTLGEKAFTRLLGPAVELLQRRAQTAYQSSSSQSSYHPRQGSQAGLEHLRSSRGASGPPHDRYAAYGQHSIPVGE